MKAAELITKWIAPSAGVVIANIMFATPMRAVLRARRESHLRDLNPVPWPAITGNCIAWIGYSYIKRDWFVFAANEPGFIMGIFYSLTAINLAPNGKTRDVLLGTFLALCSVLPCCGVLLAIPLSDWNEGRKTFFWGVLCNLILVIYYAAPLSTVVEVLRRRDARSLHWPSCTMNFVNGLCWTAYGWAIKDYFILGPNAAGMVMAAFQIALIASFPSPSHELRTAGSFFFPRAAGNAMTANGIVGPRNGGSGTYMDGVSGGGDPGAGELQKSDSQQNLVPPVKDI